MTANDRIRNQRATRAECTFHPIGQGMFYSVLLKNGNDSFTAVYDCGTESSRENLSAHIEKFKSTLATVPGKRKKELNLLVLSHLHDDHVNGVPELLKNMQLTTVILPYIMPAERVLYAAMAEGPNREMKNFYASPVEYFAERGVKNIVLLQNNSYDEADVYQIPFGYEYNKPMEHESGFIEVNISNKTDENRKLFCPIQVDQETVVSYSDRNLENLLWHFRFAMPKVDMTEDQIRMLEDLIYFIEEQIRQSSGDIAIAIGNEALLANVRKRYKDIFGSQKINHTSVLCAHFPNETSHAWSSLCDNYQEYIPDSLHCYHQTNSADFECIPCQQKGVYTLMTGDTQLVDWSIARKKLLKDNFADLISVPHHGGTPGDKLNGTGWLSLYPCHAVICYGLSNTYGHPLYKVIDDIRSSGKCRLHLSNEWCDFHYTILANQ